MTKISNQRAYIPDEEINGLDYLPGTDFDKNLKTVNFRVQDLGTHYNQVNGVRNFDFNFYAHSGPTAKPVDGFFYSNDNEKNPDYIEYFIFSKVTASGKIVGTFFENIVSNNPFDVVISQKVDVNSTFYFKIDSVESFTHYYKLNVSEIYFPEYNEMQYTLSFNNFYLKSEGILVHNSLSGLNDGDFIHLTAEEKTKFDNLPESFATKTSDLTNDGADGVNPFITLNDIPIVDLSSKLDKDFSTFTDKSTPIDTDLLPIYDVENKKLSWANLKATLKTYFDSIYTTSSAVASQISSALVGYATETFVNLGLSTKENTITAGTTSQYFRGDKTFQTLDKNAVGLGNVDNTSDLNKPISTTTQTALDSKLDKDTTAGVERAYIINADGSQDTKPTSAFKDVLEFADFDAFPTTGETGKIYIALDTNFTYRWSGSVYVQISGGGIKGFHRFQSPNFHPAANTNYYIGGNNIGLLSTAQTSNLYARVKAMVTGKIGKVSFFASAGLASGVGANVYLENITKGTSLMIAHNFIWINNGAVNYISTSDFLVDKGDELTIRLKIGGDGTGGGGGTNNNFWAEITIE